MSPSPSHPLFSPLQLGAFHLAHRVVLPALQTPLPAPHGVPAEAEVAHYAQRATPGGLLVTGATWVGPQEPTNGRVPALCTPEQVNAWRQVTAGVHARGGLLLCQLALVPPGTPATQLGDLDIDRLLRLLRDAAECAGDAGFDGVELLGLLPPPLADDSGPLLMDLIHTLGGVWAHDRVGLRLAVGMPALAAVAGSALAAGLAYVHLGPHWPVDTGITPAALWSSLSALRAAGSPTGGGVIASGGFTAASARSALDAGLVDAIGFGRSFMTNADLPYRLHYGVPLREDGGTSDALVGNINDSATPPASLQCVADPWNPGPP